jgi:hypothetical protein
MPGQLPREGFQMKNSPEEDDVEGHGALPRAIPEDDVEGHGGKWREGATGDEDTEGHGGKWRTPSQGE